MKKRLTKKEKVLNNLYTKSAVAFTSLNQLWKIIKKKKIKLTLKDLRNYLVKQRSYTLHKKIIKRYKTSFMLVSGVHVQYQADLMDVSRYKKYNKKHNFVLLVLDCFSRKVYGRPLKQKTGACVAKAFENIFENDLKNVIKKIESVQVDRGREFFNQHVKTLFHNYSIQLFASDSIYKACLVERVIKTLRKRLERYFTHYSTLDWLGYLTKLIENYNQTPHSALPLSMAPNDVTLKNQSVVWKHLYLKKIISVFKAKQHFSFKTGDFVRIVKSRNVFAKEGYNTYSEEVFRITRQFTGPPVCYEIEDLLQNKISGKFYHQELTLTIKPTFFVLDQILKRKKINNADWLYVSWLGYPKEASTWIPAKNVKSV